MRLAAALALSVLIGLTAQAQSPRADSPAATPIIGRVLADDTGDPIAYARLVVAAEGSRGRSSVRTDARGRFAVAASTTRPRILVSKPGYVPIEVVPAIDAGDIRLTRGAVVAGRAVDQDGVAVVGARVYVEPKDGRGTSVAASSAVTDDRGEYRVAPLPPGRYTVRIWTFVEAPASFGGMTINRRTSEMTFYPGTERSEDAAAVPMHAGEERTDIDFVLPAGSAGNAQFSVSGRVVLTHRLPSRNSVEPGTASVSGRVIATDGRPIAHAQVMLALEGEVTDQVSTASDEDGRFTLANLHDGDYRLEAMKVGYSAPERPRPGSLGALFMSGQLLNLAAGQRFEAADLTLAPWAAVTGRVVDEYGDPMQGARVNLFQVRYQDGRRGLVQTAISVLTNDLGVYRLRNVPPGDYTVGATVGELGTPDVPGYVRTYFPASASPALSQFFTVSRSQEFTGVDVSLAPGRTARVSGTLVDASGRPTSGGSLRLVPSASSAAPLGIEAGAETYPDGRFVFSNVSPGRYVIQASRGRRTSSIEGEFGAFPLLVGDADVSDLHLQTSAGSEISGHVVLETFSGVTATLPRRIEIEPVAVDRDFSPALVATADSNTDGSFRLAGISGPRRLEVRRLPRGWGLKQILAHGLDVTDRVLSFGQVAQSLTDVEIVLTDRITEVEGHVVDDRHRAVAGAGVVIFPADRSRWYPASRFVRMAVTPGDGGFAIEGLPFGAYYAAATAILPDGEDGWQDPEFLDALAAEAKAITLLEGQRSIVELPLLRDVRPRR